MNDPTDSISFDSEPHIYVMNKTNAWEKYNWSDE